MIRTERLVLRRFRDQDRAAFAALNADPEVMVHMPNLLSRSQSDAVVDRIEAHHTQHGFGLFAIELASHAEFIGFVGLMHPSFVTPFTPAVEIGWRLARKFWGHGYALEGARASLRFGFHDLSLGDIVSFTIKANQRSWSVMERLGMQRDAGGDFEHPSLPPGHPLRPHILYRMSRAHWVSLTRAQQ